MLKFAANLMFMFNEVPFPERFEAAARAGFTAVEFLVPFEFAAADLARWLGDHGLANVGFNMHPGDWSAGERGIASLPGREREFRASVVQALEYAAALGTPRFHPLAGIVPAGADRQAYRSVYVDNLRFAAREAAKHGRSIVMETLNTRDMPGYFLTTLADADAIRGEVGEPNLEMQMDFYHAEVAEGDVATKFTRYFEHITHVQVASVPHRHEPDEGELDYAGVFRLIDELGYAGWVGCEYRPRGRTEDGLGWMRALTSHHPHRHRLA